MDENNNRSQILSSVSDWLKLLALIVLVTESAFILLILNGELSESLKIVSYVVMILLLASVIYGIFYDRKSSRDSNTLEYENTYIKVNLKPGFFKDVEHFSKGIESALNIEAPEIFESFIKSQIERLNQDVSKWSNGELEIGTDRSLGITRSLYIAAKENVFSTSLKDFNIQWQQQEGEIMLEANKKNEASETIRVFIFPKLEGIDEIDIHAIQKNKEYGINTLILIADKTKNGDFFENNELLDFTIIDNLKIIGQTISFGKNNDRSIWYFNRKDKQDFYKNLKVKIIKNSYEYDHFIELYNASKESTK